MIKKAAPVLVILAMMLPLVANAQSVADLAAQVQALLAQITALQGQLGATTPTPSPSPAPAISIAPASSGVCPQLYRTLSRGASGADVLNLQAFLAGDVHASYSAGLTGYFGPATERAVQNWQAANGIVAGGDPASTGWGVIGARTRAAITSSCGGQSMAVAPFGSGSSCPAALPPAATCSTGWKPNKDTSGCTTSFSCSIPLPNLIPSPSQNSCGAIAVSCPTGKHDQVGANCSHACVPDTSTASGSLSVSITSGAPPLAVNFSGTNSVNGQSVLLDFGDGQTDSSIPTSAAFSRSHFYTMNGSFFAKLIAAPSGVVLGTATINVGTAAAATSVSVSANAVQQGDGVVLSWTSQYAPNDAAVGLWLVDNGGNIKGLIQGSLPTSGKITWIVPGPQCNSAGQCQYPTDNGNLIYTTVGPYHILARLYTPITAYLGGYSGASPIYPTYISNGQSPEFLINPK